MLRAVQANEHGIPIVFALSRKKLGQVFGCRKKMSAIAILDCSGADELFAQMMALMEQGRRDYHLAPSDAPPAAAPQPVVAGAAPAGPHAPLQPGRPQQGLPAMHTHGRLQGSTSALLPAPAPPPRPGLHTHQHPYQVSCPRPGTPFAHFRPGTKCSELCGCNCFIWY